MKKVLKYKKYLILALILAVIGLIFLYEPPFSKDQKKIIQSLGYPSQFVLTYLPRGDADQPQLVRSENWYYPQQAKKISFLAGKLISEEEFIGETKFPSTALKPEDFDFFLSYHDLENIFGLENIIPINFLPVFYEAGETSTYITDSALFILEADQLTYFQTLGLKDDAVIDETTFFEANPTTISTPVGIDNNWHDYQNSKLKITLQYPAEWFLENDDVVLSSYDTGYAEKGLELPEKRLKCDFFNYDQAEIDVKQQKTLLENKLAGVSVYEGEAKQPDSEESLGFGDAKLFLFQENKKPTVGLICYSYDDSFYPTLLEIFETVKLTD